MEKYCITGYGLVTSLGLDCATSCAASRTGISRASNLTYYPVRSAEGNKAYAIGHAVPFITEGFEGLPRLSRLIHAGLKDLLRQTPNLLSGQSRVAFYYSLPDPFRLYSGREIVTDDESRNLIEIETTDAQEEKQVIVNKTAEILRNAARLCGWTGEVEIRYIATSGQTGIAEALKIATDDLSSNKIDIAIVGGADSLLEIKTLAWLEKTNRLKTSTMPVGLQPGEASSFLAIESVRHATTTKEKIFAILSSISISDESASFFSGGQPNGIGLSSAINEVMAKSKSSEDQGLWIVTDQNGESWRAMEYGSALVRLRAKSDIYANPLTWYPAMSFGETYSAAGGVALSLVLKAFQRGYSPYHSALLVFSSDEKKRAAVLLKKYIPMTY